MYFSFFLYPFLVYRNWCLILVIYPHTHIYIGVSTHTYIYIFSFFWLYSHHLAILHRLGYRRHRKPRWPREMAIFYEVNMQKANWKPWSIEIDGLPFFKYQGGFSIAMLNYQRVNGGLSNQIMKPTQRWDWHTQFLGLMRVCFLEGQFRFIQNWSTLKGQNNGLGIPKLRETPPWKYPCTISCILYGQYNIETWMKV